MRKCSYPVKGSQYYVRSIPDILYESSQEAINVAREICGEVIQLRSSGEKFMYYSWKEVAKMEEKRRKKMRKL